MNILRTLLVSTALVAAPALAGPLITVSGGTPSTLGNGPYTLGYSFTASTSFRVQGLGVFDAGGDGFLEGHDVGLWDGAGNLLASTSLAQGTSGTLISGFRFASVSPLSLAAGTYRVGAFFSNVPADPLYFPNSGTVTAANGFSYLGGAYGGGTSLAFPNFDNGAGGYIGANVLGSVPEPAAWGLMIVGFGAVGSAYRRRRAQISVTYA